MWPGRQKTGNSEVQSKDSLFVDRVQHAGLEEPSLDCNSESLMWPRTRSPGECLFEWFRNRKGLGALSHSPKNTSISGRQLSTLVGAINKECTSAREIPWSRLSRDLEIWLL